MTFIKVLCISLLATEIASSVHSTHSLNYPQRATKPEPSQEVNYQNIFIREPLQITQNDVSTKPISSSYASGQLYKPANNQLEVNNFNSVGYPHSIVALKTSANAPESYAAVPVHQSAPTGKQQLARLQQQQHHNTLATLNNHQKDDPMLGYAEGLRQTVSASELNPFHHSISPALLERDLDWLSGRNSMTTESTLGYSAPSLDEQQHNAKLAGDQSEVSSLFRTLTSTTAAATTTTTTTTDQSNNIAQVDGSTSSQSHHQTGLTSIEVGVATNGSSFTSFPSLTSSTPGEIQNHVIYEGPATAPPADDYYFSSSERLPNTERASTVWWSLGFGQEYERASNLTSDDFLDYCSKAPLLESNKQRSLCRMHPKVMQIVARGIKLAIDECQSRFTSSRWNCSLVLQNTLDAENQPSQVFGEVMKHPNRERSFLNAIIAAGLAHAMTKACSQGELPGECSCDKRIKSKNNRGKIEWVACSDDIDFGARFSRDFTEDTDYTNMDTTSTINTHNYEVGRRIFKSSTDITCTCQNSLCQTKRCWKHLGPFSDIGDELIRRYESATHVHPSNKDPHKLRPVRRGVRKPKRKDLVYIDESPDYCNANTRLGILGTQNRRCNSTSIGSDSCSLLCCGRGYQVVVEELEEDCNCKFVWCCQLKCDKCKRQITNDVCN